MTTVAEIEERIESGDTVTVGEFARAVAEDLVDETAFISKIISEVVREVLSVKIVVAPVVIVLCKTLYRIKPKSVRRRLYAYLNMGVGY